MLHKYVKSLHAVYICTPVCCQVPAFQYFEPGSEITFVIDRNNDLADKTNPKLVQGLNFKVTEEFGTKQLFGLLTPKCV